MRAFALDKTLICYSYCTCSRCSPILHPCSELGSYDLENMLNADKKQAVVGTGAADKQLKVMYMVQKHIVPRTISL